MMASMRAPLVAGALLALVAAAYAPVLDNDFVDFDDDIEITDNPRVRNGLSRESVAWAFTSFHAANWEPLTRVSWMLDAELFGLDPRGFHATSVLLHAVGVLLLFAALVRMSRAFWTSALAAAIFAVHPLQVEAVAWAASRTDVLSGAFAALTLLAYAHYAAALQAGDRRRAGRLYAAVLASLALGLLAKQSLVTLPFVLLLFDAWPLERLRGDDGRFAAPRLKTAVLEKLPLLAVVLAAAAVVLLAQRQWGTVQSLEALPFGLRLGNALVAYAAYLGDCFWPVGLAVFYPHPGSALVGWQALGAAALLTIVSLVALRQWRRRPHLAIGWLLFLGSLIPVIGLVQVGEAARADRYMYLPLIGIAIATAWSLREIALRGAPARDAAVALAAMAILGLGAATAAQVKSWRDPIRLWQRALAVTGDNPLAHLKLASALTRAGRHEEASAQFAAAGRLAPASPMALGLEAELLLEQRSWREAAALFRAALRGPRDAARWHAGLGWAAFQLGELEEAVAHYESALALRPDRAQDHANLGQVLNARGQLDAAIQSYRRAFALDPLIGVSDRLALALVRRGEPEAAIAALDAALRAEPDRGEFHALRAQLLEGSGRDAEVLAGYRRALGLGLRTPRLLDALARRLATAPDADAAAREQAVQLAEEAADATGRRVPEVLDTLSLAYAAAGRGAEARQTARQALVLAEKTGRDELSASLRARLADLEEHP
jgi:tetratricopeptide (TPR) repeat protein